MGGGEVMKSSGPKGSKNQYSGGLRVLNHKILIHPESVTESSELKTVQYSSEEVYLVTQDHAHITQ